MKITQTALAGTLESSDLLVKIEPSEQLEIVINSDVNKQFGKQIRHVVESTLASLNVNNGLIIIDDKGALDCVITARIQSAVLRASKDKAQWSQLL